MRNVIYHTGRDELLKPVVRLEPNRETQAKLSKGIGASDWSTALFGLVDVYNWL